MERPRILGNGENAREKKSRKHHAEPPASLRAPPDNLSPTCPSTIPEWFSHSRASSASTCKGPEWSQSLGMSVGPILGSPAGMQAQECSPSLPRRVRIGIGCCSMNKAFKGGSVFSSSSSLCPPPLPPLPPPPPVAPLSPAPLSPWPTQTCCEQIQVYMYVCVSVGEGTASNGFPGSVFAPLSCAGVSGQFTGMSAGPQGSQHHYH